MCGKCGLVEIEKPHVLCPACRERIEERARDYWTPTGLGLAAEGGRPSDA